MQHGRARASVPGAVRVIAADTCPGGTRPDSRASATGLRRGLCGLLGLAGLVTLSGACGGGAPPIGDDRLARAFEGPCALFRDALPLAARPAVACPLNVPSPAGGAEPANRAAPAGQPCAIEYYLDTEEAPRTVRRLAYDEHGRVIRWSDHAGGHAGPVDEARQLTYEDGPGTLLAHDFAWHCDDPAPQFLFSQRYFRDAAGALRSWSSGDAGLAVGYLRESRWWGTQAFATVAVLGAGGATRGARWLALDRHGNVEAWGGVAGQTLGRNHIRYRGGLPVEVRERAPGGGFVALTRYGYDRRGRLTAIETRAPRRPRQRYVLRYACDQSPGCAAGRHSGAASTWRQPTRLHLDPQLRDFRPRDCSDHLRYGARMCGALPPAGGLRTRCCRSDPTQLGVQALSPLAHVGIARMEVTDADGAAISAASCTAGTQRNPARCSFARGALRGLSGRGHYRALDAGGQLVERGSVDLDNLAAVAH